MIKEKLETARLETLNDSEQTIAELTRRHEREKALLIEDNKKLITDMDSVSFIHLFWVFFVCFTHTHVCLNLI